ncbi:MAG: copper resistance protein CopC [Chloroflexales bacterium]|nr:copper resistance protein CopC [Chloroflexales bacterium]
MFRRLLSALLASLLAFALVGVAAAHAELVSSNPADKATLTAVPATVTLIFSEELQATGNLITVTDASGTQVDKGDTALDLNDANRSTLNVSLKSGLGAGAYTIAWENMSSDGHAEEGTLSFTVSAGAASTTLPATGAPDTLPLAGLVALAAALVALGLGMRRCPVR